MRPAARELMDTNRAAALAGIPAHRLRRWIRRDRIPYVKLGRVYAVDVADVIWRAAHPPLPGRQELFVSRDGWPPDVLARRARADAQRERWQSAFIIGAKAD